MVRQLHFGLFIYPGGHHLGGWRHPSVAAKDILGFEYYKRAAIAAERGLFDLYFVGDMLAAREREGRLVAEGALNNIDSISIDSAISWAAQHHGGGGDAFDHIQRALCDRRTLRFARPHQRRPRRLERRDDGE